MPAKQVFKMPYIGVDTSTEYPLLVGQNGECSVLIKITNPVVRYAASNDAYDEFHSLLINIVKIIGDGFILQKQDILSKSAYPLKEADEYLQQQYNVHFAGRSYIRVDTYLTITLQVKKGAFYVYDKKVLRDFCHVIGKVTDVLTNAKTAPQVLQESRINSLSKQILTMNFGEGAMSLNNLSPNDTEIRMGGLSARCINLVNTDNIDLPVEVGTHIELNDQDALKGFPVDFLSFLFKVPGFETILFSQVIDIPGQVQTCAN
jgi:hypothetical protein